VKAATAAHAQPDARELACADGALLAQTTLSLSDWEGIRERSRDAFPELWTASRDDLCFATTNRQAALREIADRSDAVIVIGSANSSNTLALAKVARDAGCETVLRIDGADELDLGAIADARIVGVTAGASAPEELVEEVIAVLDPADGVEAVPVTDEHEYFPPPRELRDLMGTLDSLLALLVAADPVTAQRPGPFTADREADASLTLAALPH